MIRMLSIISALGLVITWISFAVERWFLPSMDTGPVFSLRIDLFKIANFARLLPKVAFFDAISLRPLCQRLHDTFYSILFECSSLPLVYSDADSAFQFARIRVAASGDRSVIDAEDHAVHPSQRAMYICIPAATLFASVTVFGRLSRENELTAIKAMGISPMAIIWPTLFLSVLLSIATLWLNDLFRLLGACWCVSSCVVFD